MFKLGNIFIVSGVLLIVLSAIGSLFDFSPEIINSYYLTSTGTIFTCSGVIINKRSSLDRK